jgi:hypothetical protein
MNELDCGFAYAAKCGQDSLSNLSLLCDDFSHLQLREFCSPITASIHRPARASPICNRVALILATRQPFEVVGPIVSLVQVFMVRELVPRSFAMECFRNQHMNAV